MMLSRRQAREWAIQLLTAADLNPPDDDMEFLAASWQQIQSLDSEDGGLGGEIRPKFRKFAEERFLGVRRHQEEIDSQIGPMMEGWEMQRLNPVERAAIRLGCWELRCTDIPVPVIINEAVDLVNWYSSPKARFFVNSVLDKYAKSPYVVQARAAAETAQPPDHPTT